MGSIPVLVDDGLVLPESSAIVEHLDGVGGAPPLVPAGRAAALRARLWDRIVDGHVMTPMQKIVGDELRPEGGRDPEGVRLARAELERIYEVLDDHLADGGPGWPGRRSRWPSAPRRRRCTTRTSCTAGTRRRPALDAYYAALAGRPSVARVIDEARPYREVFPLPGGTTSTSGSPARRRPSGTRGRAWPAPRSA